MIELPLFPLNTVLFPGTPVHLHIFEPRYKAMIDRCLEHEAPFGVVLIRQGIEALGPLPEPHTVGCTARVVEVQRLPEDQLNIVALGGDRFRIAALRHDDDHAYLVGEVELQPLEPLDPVAVAEAGRRLHRWVARYLAVLGQASQGDYDFDARQLPSDPVALCYWAASVLPVPARHKQPLLAVDTVGGLLADTLAMYRRELSFLENMVAHMHVSQAGPFSRN